MQDIITALTEEHAAHRSLFARLAATTTAVGPMRLALLAELDQGLRLHMRFEEDVLFPALREHANKETRGKTLEAYAEHEAARATLNELESVAPDKEMWEAWLKVLSEELEHHMKEEEDDLFPYARELITAENRTAMAEELQCWKVRAGARGNEVEPAPPHHTRLVGLS